MFPTCGTIWNSNITISTFRYITSQVWPYLRVSSLSSTLICKSQPISSLPRSGQEPICSPVNMLPILPLNTGTLTMIIPWKLKHKISFIKIFCKALQLIWKYCLVLGCVNHFTVFMWVDKEPILNLPLTSKCCPPQTWMRTWSTPNL